MKPQDFDRLSAYIDNQLSPSEKAALEQRLGREPDLRAALSELRLTVKAVRSLPQVKPPRNFTLTPAQAGLPARGRAPRRGSLFGTLRLAASLSALALAVVVGGDLAATGGVLNTSAPAQEVASVTTERSAADGATAEEALAATPEAELSVMSAAAEETGTVISPEAAPGGGAGSDAAPTPEGTPDPAGLAVAPATATPSAERSNQPTPAGEVAETANDVDEGATQDLFDTAQAEAEATDSTKNVPPADATLETFYSTGEAESTSVPEAPGLPPVRVLEAALAMLTVLLGLGAWLASRNA